MAKIMYQSRHIRHLSKIEETNVFYWFTSIKRYFASMFTHFFQQVEDDSLAPKAVTLAYLQNNMNTQIRALTGGDITKEKEVLEMDCWRALTELNAKAKDYTGRVRADFIKRMFPDVMRDIEQDSIRNFKFQPDTGSIVIDEPDKGDYHFHVLPLSAKQ